MRKSEELKREREVGELARTQVNTLEQLLPEERGKRKFLFTCNLSYDYEGYPLVFHRYFLVPPFLFQF